MHILIIGAGSIGIAVGSCLVAAGQQVSFYARGGTLEAIRRDGVHRTGLFGNVDCPAQNLEFATDSLESLPEGHFDFLLICTKSMANPAMAQLLAQNRHILAPQGKLLIIQNGWGNDAPYLAHFSQKQICSARIITGCQRTAPNSSNVNVHTAPMLLGNLYGLDPAPLQPLAAAIDQGGLPCQVTNQVSHALWAKLLYNCALNPLGALLGVHYGALMECPQSVAIMNDVIAEIFAVMQAAGYATYWDTPEAYQKEFYGKLIPDTFAHHSSTLQDIQRKQPTEIDTLTGVVLQLGERYQIPVPANTMLYRMVKATEANYHK